jgi:hypothetical protein
VSWARTVAHRVSRLTAEPPPSTGDRVIVGPASDAVTSYVRDGLRRPARAEEYDGCEGPGVVLGVDFDRALVRLDDGRTVPGVRRSRLRRPT